ALTLLPALLSILGSRVDALRVPRATRLFGLAGVKRGQAMEEKDSASRGFWHRWAYLVMKHPWLVIAGVCSLLLVLAWPTLALNPGLPGADSLPAGSEAQQGLMIMQAQFPAVNVDPILVLAQTSDGSSMLVPRNLAK